MAQQVTPKFGLYDYINSAINLKLDCIFIAIPKTGTTSVRKQIRQKGIPWIKNPHLNIAQARDLIYPHLLRTTLAKLNDSFPNKNFPTDDSIRRDSRRLFKRLFKFSAVRNPWARAASLYFRNEGIPMSEKITFDQFCEQHCFASDTCRQPTLHNNQVDWLVDKDGTIIVDYVYKVEDFNQAIKEIKRKTNNKILLKNQVLNKNENSKSSSYRDLYSDRTKKLISKRFEKDIDLFKYSF